MTPMSSDARPDDEASVTNALRELRVGYVAEAPAHSLEDLILARAGATRQRRRAFGPGRWSSPWPPDARIPVGALLGVVGLVAVLVTGSLGTGILGAHPAPSSPASSSASAAPSAPATDAPAVNAPHIAGTCPVTPITRIAGGAAPEVDVSGLRWRWGGRPWVADAPEKVVWLSDGNDAPSVSVFATQLDRPIVLAGQTLSFAIDPSRPVYPLASDVFVGLVVVPDPGCWLLTAVWTGGASSVVVAVAPPASSPSPVPEPSRVPALGGPLPVCAATTPSLSPAPPGWPGPAYDDGALRWLLPLTATWHIGGPAEKLVIGPVDWAAKDGEVIALPVSLGSQLDRTYGSSVMGDLPSVGSGTLGFGLTLPTRDCWAIVYLDAASTSTIVTDLTQTSEVPSSSPAGAGLQVALDVERVPEPSGITCTCPDFSTYLGQLSTGGGKEIATWNLRQPSGVLNSLDPGSYSLVVSQVAVTDNVETGVRSSSAPIAQCSTELTLAPGTTTSLTATFGREPSSCELNAPSVTGP